jgi:hypothetical protein
MYKRHYMKSRITRKVLLLASSSPVITSQLEQNMPLHSNIPILYPFFGGKLPSPPRHDGDGSTTLLDASHC